MKLFLYTLVTCALQMVSKPQIALDGAWIHRTNDVTTILLFCDGYFTETTFSQKGFINSCGGKYTQANHQIIINEDYNTAESKLKKSLKACELKNDMLSLKHQDKNFKKLDDPNTPLNGVWKISKRMEGGNLVAIQQHGTRKTLKVLTGNRFQWIAFDPASNSFFGSGGGRYTFENGKYVEHIEFFSRDATRAGAALVFDRSIEDGQWHHTGLSSAGARIYEVWTKAIQ